MNKARRKQIMEIIGDISVLRTKAEEILSDEQEAFDNSPQGLQDSEGGEKQRESISFLAEVITGMEDVYQNLEDAKGEQ